jgi:hypothetical protein
MTNLFKHPKQEFIDRIRAELSDDWNRVDPSKVISFHGKTWFIKSKPEDPESKNREFLAFLLGRSWLNIPEVRLLSSEEFRALRQKKLELKLGKKASEQNTYLVRLVQDYEKSELPIQDFDNAIASEIAFSIWIRRRDTHAGNRAFVHGVPMFFDFHIALGGEDEDFFRGGPGGGYVENWRLWQIKSDTALKDIALLSYLEFDKNIAAIPIINTSHFEAALFRFTEYIRDYDRKYLYKCIQRAGFNEERSLQVNRLLQDSSENIESYLNKIVYITSKDNIGMFSEDFLKDYLKEKLVKHCSEEYQKAPIGREIQCHPEHEHRLTSLIGRGTRCYQEHGLAYTSIHLYYYIINKILNRDSYVG